MRDTLFNKAERDAAAAVDQGAVSSVEGLREAGIPIGAGSDRSLFESAVLIQVSYGRLGVERGVSTSVVSDEVGADKSRLHVSKDILVSPELDAIRLFDGRTSKMVERFCLPSQFRRGVFVLPVSAVVELDEILVRRVEMRRELVEVFMSAYDRRVNEARVLGALFDPADYPSASEVRARFYFNFDYVETVVPNKLLSVSRAIDLREREKLRADMQQVRNENIQLLRVAFADLVDHMVDRLRPSDDGKAKRFTRPLVENLDEFMGPLFDQKNSVLRDDELSALVSRGRALLQGVEAKDLKYSDVRERVMSGMVEIKAGLDAVITDRPARKIKLGGAGSAAVGSDEKGGW